MTRVKRWNNSNFIKQIWYDIKYLWRSLKSNYDYEEYRRYLLPRMFSNSFQMKYTKLHQHMVSTIETILVGQSKSTLTYYFLKKKIFFSNETSRTTMSVFAMKKNRAQKDILCVNFYFSIMTSFMNISARFINSNGDIDRGNCYHMTNQSFTRRKKDLTDVDCKSFRTSLPSPSSVSLWRSHRVFAKNVLTPA